MDWSNPVSGAIGAVGSLFGGWMQNNANWKMWNAQKDFQREERIAGQEYQTSEREAQNKYAEDMYLKYNSPQARMAQLKAAGLNPLLASDNSGVGSVQASSGSAGGAVQGHAPNVPYQSVGVWSDVFNNIAGTIKAIGEAKKIGLDTKLLQETFDNQVSQISENLRGSIIENDFKEFTNAIDKKYYSERVIKELQSLGEDIKNKRTSREEMRARINKIGKEAHLSQLEIDNFAKKMDAQIDLWASQAESNRAGATLANTQAAYTPQVMSSEAARNHAAAAYDNLRVNPESYIAKNSESQTRYNNALAALQEYDKEIIDKTSIVTEDGVAVKGLDALIWKRNQELQTMYTVAEAELAQARERRDHPKITYWSDILSKIVGMLTGTATAGAAVYGASKLGQARKPSASAPATGYGAPPTPYN